MEILAGSLAVAVLIALAILTWAVIRLRGDDLPTTGEPGARGGLTRRSFVRLGAACGVAIGVFGARRALGGEVGRACSGDGGGAGTSTTVERVESSALADPYPYSRVILPMSSGSNVPAGGSMLITSRLGHAFRPERLVLACSEDWWIEDIAIGGVSQLGDAARREGGIPGGLFGTASPEAPQLLMSTVQSTVDLSIKVRYTGVSECGAPFFCAVVGGLA